MKHGIYFRFYKIFHNEVICCFLARLFYFLFCCKYVFLKHMRKKQSVSMTVEQAKNIINKVYEKPNKKPVYENKNINNSLDLSVVIPVYNYADIIEENILSILNQKTIYNYEVIFVDDGSTDGAKEILQKYADNPKVKLVFQQNGGIGQARNTGINESSGKYLMFIDCDDVVHNDIVEVLLDNAYNQNCDIVMAGHNLVKERNKVVYEVVPNIYPQSNLIGYKNGDKIMNFAGLPWCKVYKRELWNNVRFFPGYWYEDTIIQFLIFTQSKKFNYIPKVEYEYKWYEKNFSHIQGNASNIKTIDSYYLLCEIIDTYNKIGLKNDDVFYTLLLRHISAFYYTSIQNLDDELVQAMFVLAKDLFIKNKPNHKVKLPYILKQTELAFINNDISLWKLASCYQ